MKLEDFRGELIGKKPYKDLPDNYKLDKFLRLYLKIYEYMLSIPKDELVYKNDLYKLLKYIKSFIRAKDFYNWRYRIYTLLTKKLGTSNFLKWQLLYNSKAKEYYNEYIETNQKAVEEAIYKKYGVKNVSQSKEVQEKKKQTCLKNHGVEYPMQSKEVQEKIKKKNLERRGVEYALQDKKVRKKSEKTIYEKFGTRYISQSQYWRDKTKKRNNEKFGVDWYSQTNECKEKVKKANNKRYNVDWYFQSDEFKEKSKKTNLERHGAEYYQSTKEFRERYEKTNLERRGVTTPFKLVHNDCNHSKIADEFCISFYNKLPDDMKHCCIFFKKDNKEYMLRDKDRICRYDFTISSESIKVIVEFDGIYWHGLMEGQKFVRDIPVKEIWEKDREKQRLAEDMGFRVIRVREDEYERDKEGCIERVLNEVFGIR